MTDELHAGSERFRRVPGRVLAAVAILLIAAFAFDRWRLGEERTALVRCVENGQAQISYADHKIAALVQYASPALTGAQTPTDVRTGLQDIVQQAAEQAIGPTDQAARSCEAAVVLPWHRATATARVRYTSYLDSETAHLRAGADRFDALSDPSPELAANRQAARTAVLAAVAGSQATRVGRVLSP